MLSSAENVALAHPVCGASRTPNKTDDYEGAAALAAAVRHSSLVRPEINAALSAAMANGLRDSIKATTVLSLVATAVMLDNSTAVANTAGHQTGSVVSLQHVA